MSNENFTRRRQQQLAGRALKNRRSELLFERKNLPANCGRRDIELFGGLTDRA
ncbi:hypothetical protein D3C80_2069640 [compost metagenome]